MTYPLPSGHSPSQRDAELIRAIFEAAVECIITIDDRGRIESANPAVFKHFGYHPEELVGQNVSILMPSPDRERHDQHLRSYQQTGQRKIIGIGREVLACRRDGTTFPAYLAVSEMNVGGQRKFAGIIHDISDRKRYEQSLQQRAAELDDARQHLEAANHAKDHFLAVLSHELRTPLTPALAMLSLLEAEPNLQDQLRDTLHTIRRNIELEARLIDDLLDLTRITRGRLKLNSEPADIHASIAEAIDICATDLRNHRLTLRSDLKAVRHTVLADRARLQQILWNLLKNAIKFTPKGGHIDIRTWNDDTALLTRPSQSDPPPAIGIEVADTGIGIEPDALPRIFSAFEQASASISRQFGGLGLGLAITRALVEMHGGRILAYSDGRGTGARFHVLLPLVTSGEPEKASGSEAEVVTQANGQPTIRILLVEDHPDTLRAIRLLLTRQGHEVACASNVAESREQLAREFDLVISDIGLPDGSGLEVIQHARSRWPNVRGIALSGYGMEEDIARSHAAGFQEHLTKPINLPTLRDAVQRSIAASQ